MEDLVYVIGPSKSSVAKIGHSVAPPKRLQQIQAMSPLPLAILWTCSGGEPLERRLHSRLSSYRTHGEWFDFRGLDPVETVQAAVAAIEKGDVASSPAGRQARPTVPSGTRPDCVCDHGYAHHGSEGCTLYNGPDDWDRCPCSAYISVRVLESVPSLTRVPEPRAKVSGWQGPHPQERLKIREDYRYALLVEEICAFTWPDGIAMVPGWWAEHAAEFIVWRLRETPDADRQPAVVLDEVVRLRWGRKDRHPMVPGVFAERLTDKIMQNLV